MVTTVEPGGLTARYRVPDPQPDGTRLFSVVVAGPMDVPYRQTVFDALKRINDLPHFRKSCVRVKVWMSNDPADPTPLAANPGPQRDIEAYKGRVRDQHILVALIQDRVGRYTREEIDEALGATPPLWTLVYCPRSTPEIALDARPDDEERIRLDWSTVRQLYKDITDGSGVVHFYQRDERAEEFARGVAEKVQAYLLTFDDRPTAEGKPALLPELDPENDIIYPGLRSFAAADSRIFFGRRGKRDEIVASLERGEPVVCIQGHSGAGKSSLARAGVIAKLQEEPMVWQIIEMRPNGGDNGDPFAGLAHGILAADASLQGTPPARLAELLRSDEEEFFRDSFPITEGSRRLLYIDQLEEVLIECDAPLRDRFVDDLTRWVHEGRVQLLATIRADVQPLVCQHEALAALLGNKLDILTPPQSPQVIVDIITNPAALAGLELEHELLTELSRQTLADPSSLPLLAASLEDIHGAWKVARREQPDLPKVLRRTDFPGFDVVIQRRVEAALRSFSQAERRRLPDLLALLVDVDISGRPWRRTLRRRSVADDATLAGMTDALIRHRLLTSEDDGGESGSAEVGARLSHERLLRAWPELSEWIDRNSRELEELCYLEMRARRWNALADDGGRSGELLSLDQVIRFTPLFEAQHWRLQTGEGEDPTEVVRSYLEASLHVRERQALTTAIRQGEMAEVLRLWNQSVRLEDEDLSSPHLRACYQAMTYRYAQEHQSAEPGVADAASHSSGMSNRQGPASSAAGIAVRNAVEGNHEPVHFAALVGNLDSIKALELSGADLSAQSSTGATPLIFATKGQAPEAVRYLLRVTDDAGKADTDGNTALHYAAANGPTEIVATLLEQASVDPDARNKDGCTTLHAAAIGGRVEWVELLLDLAGDGLVDLNARDHSKLTPLHGAALRGHAAAAEALLSLPGIECDLRDENGQSPLHLAALNGHVEIVEMLLRTGRVEGAARDETGWAPLHMAAQNGRRQVVDILLKTPEVDPNARENRQWTPLHLAAQGYHLEVLELLLATPGIEVDACEEDQWTAMHLAAQNGHCRVVELLLSSGAANPNARTSGESTPLHLASNGGHADIVELLLHSDDVLIEPIEASGWTPLHVAAHSGHCPVAKLLLAAPGTDPNARDRRAWTPLHLAAVNGHADFVALLLGEPNVDPVPREEDGWTPLHLAAQGGDRLETVAMLSDGRANDERTNRGMAAIHLAVMFRQRDVLHCLMQRTDINLPVRLEPEHAPSPEQIPEEVQNRLGQTCLHIAASGIAFADGASEADHQYLEIVGWLLEGGADPNRRDDRQRSPLALANRHPDVLGGLLRAHGLDLLAPVQPAGSNPVLLCAESADWRLLADMLGRIEDPGVIGTDEDGDSLAHLMAMRGAPREMIEGLLDALPRANAAINLPNKSGRTPLMVALAGAHEDTARVLLSLGAEPQIVTPARESALLLATAMGAPLDLARELYADEPATLDCLDARDMTPLHHACAASRTGLIEWIEGLAPHLWEARDNWGRLPLDLAAPALQQRRGRPRVDDPPRSWDDHLTWEPVTGADHGRLVARARAVGGRRLTSADTRVEMAVLSFYDEAAVRLVRLWDPRWPENVHLHYFSGTPGDEPKPSLVQLDGTSLPIHQYNEAAPVRLDEDNVLDYLRFFTFFVRSEESPFLIAERTDQNGMPTDLDDAERDTLGGLLRPACLLGRAPDTGNFRAMACVYHQQAVYLADFEIETNGMITMVDDYSLASDLSARVDRPVV